jgi:hypothetical protein
MQNGLSYTEFVYDTKIVLVMVYKFCLKLFSGTVGNVKKNVTVLYVNTCNADISATVNLCRNKRTLISP